LIQALDIDNYYSIDNGVTWLTYTGEFQSLEGTVKAKSVKRDTGLTAEITKHKSTCQQMQFSHQHMMGDNTNIFL